MDTASLHYPLKKVSYKQHQRCILLQNTNGPCPLLAIANILLIRGELSFQGDVVPSDQLVHAITEHFMTRTPQFESTEAQLNYERNVSDCISIIPHLEIGLDVNVRFSGVRAFEFTTNNIIFDLFNINLFHGWIAPKSSPNYQLINKYSYNQAQEKIILSQTKSQQHEEKLLKDPNAELSVKDREIIYEGQILQKWIFNESPTQLTDAGIVGLHEEMRENELGVLFRNNHFSTILKHKGNVFQLVTDVGFMDEDIVWELLTDVEGNTQFVDGNFSLYEHISDPSLRLARQLQNKEDEKITGGIGIPAASSSDLDEASLMLAMKLQEKEDSKIAKMQQHWEAEEQANLNHSREAMRNSKKKNPQKVQMRNSRKKEKKGSSSDEDCVIL